MPSQLVSYIIWAKKWQNIHTAFGSVMQTRSFSSVDFRYGFNGKEKEADGTTDNYDFGARIYDGRLGRWLGVDPLARMTNGWTPYRGFFNSPLYYSDHSGQMEYQTIIVKDKYGNTIAVKVENSCKYMTDGLKHERDDKLGDGTYFVNCYYDYETITTRTMNEDGTFTESIQTNILLENGIKDEDGVFFGGDDYGDVKTLFFDNCQADGFYISSQEATAGSGKTKFVSAADAQQIHLEDIIFAMKLGSKDKLKTLYDKAKSFKKGLEFFSEGTKRLKEAIESTEKTECITNACSNSKCDRNNKALLKTNPFTPHKADSGGHDFSAGEVVVDCDDKDE